MTNPIRGEVPLAVGEKQHVLRFTVNAMVALEEAFGQSLAEVSGMLADPERFKLKDWRTVMWAMLLHEDPT